MGVHGLWKLLEPAGKAVALECLQNKILGVDVSIWLHQAVKGFQDTKGSPLPNAHLLGIFHRVCKLLFYRIKPVFVFDGGVPVLKKNTIAARRKLKGRASRDAKQVAEQLLKNLVKHKAVCKVLGEKACRNTVLEELPRKDENLFKLPPMLNDFNDIQSLSSDSEISVKYEASGGESDSDSDIKYLSPSKVYAMNLDLHTLDVSSENFRSLPADVRHDILSDLKETRKQSSWGRLHEMPKESTDFSSFQLNRLLKRRTVQVFLEEAEKEMGGKVLSMAELEDIMSAQGIKLEDGVSSSKEAQLNAFSKRIASDVATRYLLVSGSSKKKDSADEVTSDTKEESQDVAEKNTDTKITVKHEHEDDWSSDDGSLQEVKVKNKIFDDKIQIKQEYEDDWSSDNEAHEFAADENLAKQYVHEKYNLSQAEILALIQNEKDHDSRDGCLIDIQSTSTAASATPRNIRIHNRDASKSKVNPGEPCSNKSNFLEMNSSVANFVETNTKGADIIETNIEKVDFMGGNCSKIEACSSGISTVENASRNSNLRTPAKEILARVTTKSDSDNDFDEVLPVESENIEGVVRAKLPLNKGENKHNIQVVIGKNLSYEPEDDIFADIFPDSMITIPTAVIRTPEGTKTPSTNSVTEAKSQPKESVLEAKPQPKECVVDMETPVKIGGVQENVETVLKSKVDEQKKTPFREVCSPNKEGVLDNTGVIGQNMQSSKTIAVPEMTAEELKSLEFALEDKHEELLAEKGRQERLAASITDQMCAETQELLRLFGVPYIVAPMEAEAQCAFLDSLSLTEGTITDDSDIWLFGGNKVYKNFFNQKKHVLQYTSTTIQHYLKLERYHMVLLALLVGSDYTTGLQGIGPVTAMEILAAFPPGNVDKALENRDSMVEGLRRFRDWWQTGRPQRSAATTQLRNKVKDVHFFEGFPSLAVVEAYLRPAIDESKETFSWGDLDLQGLREFARMKFGWAQAKTDEILLPVAKRVAERKNQRFIDSYFNAIPQYNEGEKKMSKRVKKAIRRMENEEDENDSEGIDDPGGVQNSEKTKSKRRGSNAKKRRIVVNDEDVSAEVEERGDDVRQKSNAAQRRPVKKKKQVNDEEENTLGENTTKRSKIPHTVVQDVKESSGSNETNDFPKPRPRQRTSTGVVRTGAKRTTSNIVPSCSSQNVDEKNSQPRKKLTQEQACAFLEKDGATDVMNTRKPVTKKQGKVPLTPERNDTTKVNVKSRTQKTATKKEPKAALDRIAEDDGAIEIKTVKTATKNREKASIAPIVEENQTPPFDTNGLPIYDDFEPRPGTSRDVEPAEKQVDPPTAKDEDPDEEEEAILAALHAMDWDDDPWGGFQPQEKMYFGGVRKNAPKPQRAPPPPPLPPLPSTQPVDTRGYRPGARTLDRIESRVTQPQLEWNTSTRSIPQKERDRQQAEESKIKAIKLFKAAGAMKTSKFLGDNPANSKRKLKKKKMVAKVRELDLSEESSDD